jgi:hypothetical protein
MASRLEPGAVFEVRTPIGLAYGQVTHVHEQWGALCRMFKGFHDARPDLSRIVDSKVQFKTFFPLKQAIRARIASLVGHSEVPSTDRRFPLFRAPGPTDRQGLIHGWWLWDGDREWKIQRLSPEQRRLPIREVINDTLLIERLQSGWAPEVDDSVDA